MRNNDASARDAVWLSEPAESGFRSLCMRGAGRMLMWSLSVAINETEDGLTP